MQIGETIFVHASVVQGGEVHMVGTDASAQAVSDDVRVEGASDAEELGGARRGPTKWTQKRRTKWHSKCV